jgi:hypothetical protein
METGLKGNLLPDNEVEFATNFIDMKFVRCVSCGTGFSNKNVFSRLGWRESQISGFCESCFDKVFEAQNDE